MAALKLSKKYVEKPWGRTDLPQGFAEHRGDKVGEVWFDAPAGMHLPLLVKYIFTSEKLSIQVHPNNAQARESGLPGGKSECWYILHAGSNAVLGIGTTRHLDENELRAAAGDGSLESIIDWKPVQAGDFFYIPAGTIHAIGPDITLVEVQQNNDVTYRLYDYGRPRDLHLEAGAEVSKAEPYRLPQRRITLGQSRRLLEGSDKPFCLDMVSWGAGEDVALPSTRAWFVPISGSGTVDQMKWQGGECWLLDGNPALVVDQSMTGFVAWQVEP